MRKLVIRLCLLLAVAGAVAGGFYLVQQVPRKDEREIALAQVQRGDLLVRSFFRGELRAVRSLTLTAPNLGSQSQVTALAPAGSLASRGNLIFELDDSERVAALEDDLLSVEKIEEQLKQAEAELEIRKMQDEVELVRADFQVRRAELEVRRNELVSAIDARKNELTLEEAKRRKLKLEEDIKNRLDQREAELAVLREQINKANLDVRRERQRIAQARVLAPISGLVSILRNRSGGRGGFGTTTPDVREGDQVPAGMAVAQLLDLSEMELVAKVEEVERAHLREGQEALIRLDALPGKVVRGTIKRLGNTAGANIFRGEATKKFDCILAIDMNELLQHVGAEPEQIRRILATAEQNRAQGFGRRATPAAAGAASPGPAQAGARGGNRQAGGRRGGGQGQRAGRRPGGKQGAGQGGSAAEGAQQAQRGSGGGPQGQGGGRQANPQARQRFQEMLGGRDPSELSDEERQKLRQQMQQAFQRGGGQGRPGGGQGDTGGARSGGGGLGGPRAGARSPGGGPSAPPAGRASPGGSSAFTAGQRENAQLPQPPREGSDVDVLLRPGLLADAEVIVEKLDNVLYIPYQAVFDGPQGPVVYAWNGSSLEPQAVELGKRSESQVVLLSGLEEGDQIGLQPPGRPGSSPKKKGPTRKKSGGQPSLPGGGRRGI